MLTEVALMAVATVPVRLKPGHATSHLSWLCYESNVCYDHAQTMRDVYLLACCTKYLTRLDNKVCC